MLWLLLSGILLGITASARAADLPAPPGSAAGSLVIVGGGGLPSTIRDRFLELAGGKKARLVVIPTASDKADFPQLLKGPTYWRAQGAASVIVLHTRNRALANDPTFVKPLAEATGVWISGGDQSRLVAAYHGTAVERELQKVLERGGVIGGTSAGASVMSAVMIVGGERVARTTDGFGLLPGVIIDQHFQNRHRLDRLLGLMTKYPQYLGLGIDEETAVVIHGNAIYGLGDANVRICMPVTGQPAPQVRVLKSGDHLDLLALRPPPPARAQKPATQPMPMTTAHHTALSP